MFEKEATLNGGSVDCALVFSDLEDPRVATEVALQVIEEVATMPATEAEVETSIMVVAEDITTTLITEEVIVGRHQT